MPAKTRRRAVSADWDCRLEELLVSQVTNRTFVIYSLSNGPYEDIATSVQRRFATFEGRGWDKDLRHEITKAKDEQGSYHRWYEGLPGAISDHEIEDTQVADDAAEQAKREDELLTDPERASGWYNHGLREEQEQYEAFMNAIDTLSDNDEDEAAWAAIDAWRNRLALKHEK